MPTLSAIRLTPTQQRVLALMGRNWSAENTHGSAVTINGQRVCNLSTLEALAREGLIEKGGQWSWRATERGREVGRSIEVG